MRRILFTALGLFACSPLLAASALDALPTDFNDRDKVHALVVALENEPRHANAALAQVMLEGHYKDVDFLVCGQVIGPLAGKKRLAPVMLQLIIASGDWVEAHPDQAKDIDAYTLAGLESGVRLYRNLLKLDPKAQDDALDALVKEYEANTLPDWNKAHPCRPE